jgi:hypothetical protein
MKTVNSAFGFALAFVGIAFLLASERIATLLIGNEVDQKTSEKVWKMGRRIKILAMMFLTAGLLLLASDPPLFGT